MNNTTVREIRGAKINPKSSFKIRVRKIRGGRNYARKYGICTFKQFYLGSHSELDTCSYELYILSMTDNITPPSPTPIH